jgi:hypothetical protein
MTKDIVVIFLGVLGIGAGVWTFWVIRRVRSLKAPKYCVC